MDKYPINVGAGEGGSGGEGDPIAVAWGRSTTYGKRAKKLLACSPTVEGKSRIAQEYANSNMSIFEQECPHCKFKKELTWLDVTIPRDPITKVFDHVNAVIKCTNCHTDWTESGRHYSIRNGKWRATKPEITWHHGYKVSAMASPFLPIVALAKEFSDAQGSPERLKAFYNTRMAQTWREVGEQPDWERLYENREEYKISQIHKGGLLITCGIDVQKDYLLYEVVAWGRKKESWSVEKGVIQGNIEDDATKVKVGEFLDRTFTNHVGVEVPIMKINIDSGYNTQAVYEFCRWYGSADRLVPIKGDANLKTIIGTPRPVDVNVDGKRIARGMMLWGVGSSIIKEQIYRWLNLKRPTDVVVAEHGYPSGFSHFPQYDEEFFKQLTAEQYTMKTDNRGFHSYVWENMRRDNHYLDCRVYARSASAMLQMDRMNDDDWTALETAWTGVSEETTQPVQLRAKVAENKRESNWMKK